MADPNRLETLKQFRNQIKTMIKDMSDLVEMWMQDENTYDVCNEFNEDYPFHKSLDELVTDCENWQEKVEDAIEQEENKETKSEEGLESDWDD